MSALSPGDLCNRGIEYIYRKGKFVKAFWDEKFSFQAGLKELFESRELLMFLKKLYRLSAYIRASEKYIIRRNDYLILIE